MFVPSIVFFICYIMDNFGYIIVNPYYVLSSELSIEYYGRVSAGARKQTRMILSNQIEIQTNE